MNLEYLVVDVVPVHQSQGVAGWGPLRQLFFFKKRKNKKKLIFHISYLHTVKKLFKPEFWLMALRGWIARMRGGTAKHES